MIKVNLLENHLYNKKKKKTLSSPSISMPGSKVPFLYLLIFILGIASPKLVQFKLKNLQSDKEELSKEVKSLHGQIEQYEKYKNLLNSVEEQEKKFQEKKSTLKALFENKLLNYQMVMLVNALPNSVYLVRTEHDSHLMKVIGRSVDYDGVSSFVDGLKSNPDIKAVELKKTSPIEGVERVEFEVLVSFESHSKEAEDEKNVEDVPTDVEEMP